jgi:hypothetical protein
MKCFIKIAETFNNNQTIYLITFTILLDNKEQ